MFCLNIYTSWKEGRKSAWHLNLLLILSLLSVLSISQWEDWICFSLPFIALNNERWCCWAISFRACSAVFRAAVLWVVGINEIKLLDINMELVHIRKHKLVSLCCFIFPLYNKTLSEHYYLGPLDFFSSLQWNLKVSCVWCIKCCFFFLFILYVNQM